MNHLWLGLKLGPRIPAADPPPPDPRRMQFTMPRIKNPQQLHDFVAQFVTAVTPHLADIPGLTAGQLTALTTQNTTLATDITAEIAAHEAAKTATQATKNQATTLNNLLDAAADLVMASTVLDPTVKTNAGLHARDTVKTTIIPVAPTDLVVTGRDTGENELRWKSGGNLKGVTYVIEGRAGSSGPFLVIRTTTKTSFIHTGQTPGQRMEYRVLARRTDFDSAYSNTAVVYP